VPLPADWRTTETARHAFRQAWCQREGLEMAICDHPETADRPRPGHVNPQRRGWCDRRSGGETAPANYTGADCDAFFADLDRRFETAWEEERRTAVANRDRLHLSGLDLRRADAMGASMVGADLGGARLEGAYLSEARLEKVDLFRARLEGAILSRARLEGADLTGARLEGAYLSEARLEKVSLVRARLEGADLNGARLEGTNLRYADFRQSKWAGASNRASPAHFADYRGAQGLTQLQLEELIGNAGTLLSEGLSDTGEPWYVWSCWEQPPADLDWIVATAAGPLADDVARSALRVEFLCGPGNPRHRTGTPCPAELAREECQAWAVARGLVGQD
jgi:hypothetical protein